MSKAGLKLLIKSVLPRSCHPSLDPLPSLMVPWAQAGGSWWNKSAKLTTGTGVVLVWLPSQLTYYYLLLRVLRGMDVACLLHLIHSGTGRRTLVARKEVVGGPRAPDERHRAGNTGQALGTKISHSDGSWMMMESSGRESWQRHPGEEGGFVGQ
jgi:hypothetical protein